MPELFDGSQDEGEVSPEVQGQSSIPKSVGQPAQEPSGKLPKESAPPTMSQSTIDRSPNHKCVNPDEYSEVLRNERPTSNAFQAFSAKPVSMHFDSQSREERILLLLRRHPVTQLPWILIALIFSFLPFGISTFPILNTLPPNYLFAFVVGWYLLLTGFILESFLTWFFNVYIITDERIIDVDFVSLIYKNVSTAKIDNIQDVTAKSGGVAQALFHYGTVQIQTAGEKREFEFEDVPHPEKVTRLLNELILEEEREKLEGRVS